MFLFLSFSRCFFLFVCVSSFYFSKLSLILDSFFCRLAGTPELFKKNKIRSIVLAMKSKSFFYVNFAFLWAFSPEGFWGCVSVSRFVC